MWQVVGDEAFAESLTCGVEQVTDVVIHGEVEHLPPRFDQREHLFDEPFSSCPVGMLEGVVEDQEGGQVIKCSAGETESGSEEDLFAGSGAEVLDGKLVVVSIGDHKPFLGGSQRLVPRAHQPDRLTDRSTLEPLLDHPGLFEADLFEHRVDGELGDHPSRCVAVLFLEVSHPRFHPGQQRFPIGCGALVGGAVGVFEQLRLGLCLLVELCFGLPMLLE